MIPDPLDLTAILKEAGWSGTGGTCLNLGAGYCGSPISRQIPELPFDNLDNVELFLPYFEALTRLSYKATLVSNWHDDVFQWLEEHPALKHDFVLLIDIVEHFTALRGIELIHKAIDKANKAVLLWVPIGYCPQEPYDNNPYQKHLSTWTKDMTILPFINDITAEFFHYPKFHGHVDAAWVVYKKVDNE